MNLAHEKLGLGLWKTAWNWQKGKPKVRNSHVQSLQIINVSAFGDAFIQINLHYIYCIAYILHTLQRLKSRTEKINSRFRVICLLKDIRPLTFLALWSCQLIKVIGTSALLNGIQESIDTGCAQAQEVSD